MPSLTQLLTAPEQINFAKQIGILAVAFAEHSPDLNDGLTTTEQLQERIEMGDQIQFDYKVLLKDADSYE